VSVDYSLLIVDDVEPPLPSGQQFWHAVAILPFGDHRSLFAAAVVFDANSIWQAVPRLLKLETHGLGENADWRQGNSSDGQRLVWTTPEQIVAAFETRWASDAFFREHAPEENPQDVRNEVMSTKYGRQLATTIKYLDLLKSTGCRVLLDRR
jgi:hypothetical protein